MNPDSDRAGSLSAAPAPVSTITTMFTYCRDYYSIPTGSLTYYLRLSPVPLVVCWFVPFSGPSVPHPIIIMFPFYCYWVHVIQPGTEMCDILHIRMS